MKRWEYKIIKIQSKSVMKRVQIQTSDDGWEIESIKDQNGNVVATFRKEKNR